MKISTSGVFTLLTYNYMSFICISSTSTFLRRCLCGTGQPAWLSAQLYMRKQCVGQPTLHRAGKFYIWGRLFDFSNLQHHNSSSRPSFIFSFSNFSCYLSHRFHFHSVTQYHHNVLMSSLWPNIDSHGESAAIPLCIASSWASLKW